MQAALKSFTFPPVNYFSQFWQEEQLLLDVHENYQKRSFRNKYQVLGPNGTTTLSIPLQKGKHQQQNI
ncbi:MAG TPA: WbqC family protein, partial [Saprospiraceae bacterium]|nr:WbqC family protein [Saprospiraceae bacterium]